MPDMPKESGTAAPKLWFRNAYESVENELEIRLDPRVSKLRTMETGYSLSPRHIEMYRDWALKAQEAGERALFVFDSYSSLVANFTQIDEVKAAFAQPLQTCRRPWLTPGPPPSFCTTPPKVAAAALQARAPAPAG